MDEQTSVRTFISPPDSDNPKTLHTFAAHLKRPSPEALFKKHYQVIRKIGRTRDSPGLGVFAIRHDHAESRVESAVHVEAPIDGPTHLTAGRHSSCELQLSHSSVSLRQLLLVLEPMRPRAGWMEFRYRVLDLHSSSGSFEVADGNAVFSIEVEGSTYIRLPHYTVFFLLTGDRTDYPEMADDAWKCLPETVILREFELAEGSAPRKKDALPFAAPPMPRASHVTISAQVSAVQIASQRDTQNRALRLRCGNIYEFIVLNATTVDRGVLIGRYRRCNSDVLQHDRISRVHAVVLRICGDIWLFDTASTNGVRDTAGQLKRICLVEQTQVAIGTPEAMVTLV